VFVVSGPRKRIVTPLSCDLVVAWQELSVDHNAAADTRPKNDAEHHATVSGRAIDCLGKGKAIRVVFEADWAAQFCCKVTVQWVPVQGGGVRVLDEASPC
jgi:hypothetical protein